MAALTALLTLVLIPLNDRKRDHRDFEMAKWSYRNKVSELVWYLERHPTGLHAAEAEAMIEALYDDAERKIETHRDSEMAPMMRELVKTLRARRSTRVGVRYESKTLFDKLDMDKLPDELRNNLIDPRPAFTDQANTRREVTITAVLQKAFNTMLGENVVTIGSDSTAAQYRYDPDTHERQPIDTSEPPASFIIAYEVRLTGSLYESKKDQGPQRKFLGVAFFWDFGVQLEGAQALAHRFVFDSEPAKDIRWTTSRAGSASPTLPYDKMAESAFDDFKAQLTTRFGGR